MILLNNPETTSPILLSVLLIVYLIIAELGNKKIRKITIPIIIVLTIVFLIIASLGIYSTYSGIK